MNKVFAVSISCVIALFCVNVVFSDVSHLNPQQLQAQPQQGIIHLSIVSNILFSEYGN